MVVTLKFTIYGHPNITARHATTLEFTKDDHVTKTGDCILGIKADYSLAEATKLLRSNKLRLILQADELVETVSFIPNPTFVDEREMVIRVTEFVSERTFGLLASKAAKDISRDLVKKLQDPLTRATVTIEAYKE